MTKRLLILFAILLAACNTPPTETPAATSTNPPEQTATATESVATTSTDQAPTPTEATATKNEAEAATSEVNHLNLLRQILLEARSREAAQEILVQIENTGDARFVAGLIDTMRYQRALVPEISETLTTLTGVQLAATESPFPDWHDWVEWAGQHPEIESFAEYDQWKSTLFGLVDPAFSRFVYPGVTVAPNSRLEEIVWGGVRVDGIPALDNPTMVDPAEADYLEPQERVFGVSINGDTRAYPARFLDWHEMFNDVVGDEAVSLAY